ncbi:CitMHS family transporter [Enterococcus cecorum]|uniref:CitMHS family transporter n=1 Tax=Enterococcus cecorum TaxID=44008 RepID=UPI0022D82E57|nr:CitMHS family transporter [Enterococcus cecorum]CAI3273412.1 CitMHS family transporter [Enterococcus cecorum]CAI3331932.1 CitMHS family transporter [Enterococcus cecorum]CAI3341580.1 CitMHS family transporter [Enterococcus cecorum]CAI3362484.1 CitMHS family transporter [Enterococcus cecorum]CAI3367082.1 CitMHS family transporter [Enterococcus cecorum]
MLLTVLSYAMIIVFMFVIMKKKMSPFTALVLVPLVFTMIAKFSGIAAKGTLGEYVLSGVSTTANTGIMLLFAILYFSIMLDTGLFDPITNKMIRFAKGDPMRVLMATAIVAAAVSLNGDGTTTTLICCSAFIPIYKKLGMKLMNLGVLVILQNTIMNLLPWGGPTARAMAVLKVDADILSYLLPGMVLSLLYVIFFVARRMGKQERERLGITQLTEAEILEMTTITDQETLEIRRPNNWLFNAVLTIVLIAWLVSGSFIEKISLPPLLLFLVGTCIALIINYPVLKDQSKRIGANGGDAVQVVILVFAAGIFMGLFQGSGMAEALAESFTQIIPKQLGAFWGIIIALISAPGTFFLSNDGFYFGVLPVLAEAGRQYGFSDMQMALASLMGQAFHLLSPLVAFIYLLLRLTGLDMGQWQRTSAKYALGIFLIFVVTITALGFIPIYVPQ